ncbi:MAG: YhcH/YjgK/YiaL family protein [Bacteroidales bacterium]|nr:YhcH/YjgK/YiaL family protein [Candidatus Colicola caccequi]MCQ2328510.1 YhcH/YjgK/YiaL family protein [Paludibacteraceae bacterium]
MILDKLENADLYFEAVPRFREFMQFFNDNDLEELPACKIKLMGDDLFVNILDFKGKAEKDCKMEAHQDYIDIQIPLGDDEQMGWKAQEDCQEVSAEYDEGKDVEFYKDKATTMLTVPKGHFVVFFPSDAHQPGIAAGKSYRKIIVKTKISEN